MASDETGIAANVLAAVGRTPLVHLGRMARAGAQVLLKLESLNPGGSIKTRSALGMIEAAEADGKLRPDSIIVEPTSGNQGIGMALVGAVKGYRVRIVMPETMSLERRRIIQAYGAELVLTPAGATIDETFAICIARAQEMAAQDPRVFIPQQFENPANPDIHARTTAQEILEQVGGPIHALVAAIGTGGTITGVARALKQIHPQLRVVAVEPATAAILSGGPIGTHAQQGIGDGFIPKVLRTALIDQVVTVTDDDALATTRRLAREEGILAGVSSGSNVWAAMKVAAGMRPEETVVTFNPDTGERYLSTALWQ